MTKEEFEEKIIPMSRNLFRFAFRFLSSREGAEDATQDVCIKLWNMRDKLSEYRNVEALAMTMTRNHCLDILRKKGREILDETRATAEWSEDTNPHKDLEKSESYQNVMEIVNDLPEHYRTVIQLRDIDGYEYDEIVEMLEININTLRVNLSRARKMVRDRLKDIDYERA
jgi:RNA polymerase sigma-70 factor (ECF subfamily)